MLRKSFGTDQAYHILTRPRRENIKCPKHRYPSLDVTLVKELLDVRNLLQDKDKKAIVTLHLDAAQLEEPLAVPLLSHNELVDLAVLLV